MAGGGTMITPQTATAILQYVPVAGGVTVGVVLSMAETLGAIDPIALWEKFGITGIAGAGLYLLLRYLLKERERLERKIDEMNTERAAEHDKRLAEAEQRYERLSAKLDAIADGRKK